MSVLLASVVVAIVVGNQVRSIVLKGAGSVVGSGAAALVQGCLVHSSGDPFTPECLDDLRTVVDERMSGSNLMVFRVLDLDGQVVFSTMSGEVGSIRGDTGSAASLGGKSLVEVVSSSDEPLSEAATEDRALKVTTPLVFQGTGEVIGVIETYKPYSQVEGAVRSAVLVVVLAVLIGALVSCGSLLMVIRHATAELDVHAAEAASLNARLHTSLMDLEEASLGTLQALSAAVDAKDSYTARHSLGVTGWANRIGHSMGLQPQDMAVLERAGLLHDIGKIGVPEEILLKPGSLSDAEFERIKEHPGEGARILQAIPFLTDEVAVVRSHHERWDGTGYPDGLPGAETPRLARVLAVADAYDAMTTDRPYRRAMTGDEARREIKRNAGTQFDPAVVVAFLQIDTRF